MGVLQYSRGCYDGRACQSIITHLCLSRFDRLPMLLFQLLVALQRKG